MPAIAPLLIPMATIRMPLWGLPILLGLGVVSSLVGKRRRRSR